MRGVERSSSSLSNAIAAAEDALFAITTKLAIARNAAQREQLSRELSAVRKRLNRLIGE